jgi:hypothetical protein
VASAPSLSDQKAQDFLNTKTICRAHGKLVRSEKTIKSGAIDVIQFEFNEMNVISRTFFKDFFDFLPEYDFFRLTHQGALFIRRYTPCFCEIFAYQNIVCVRKGLNVFNL